MTVQIVAFWVVILRILKVDTNVLEEYAVSIFRIKVSRVEIWSGYVGRLQGRSLRSTHRRGRGVGS
jgi:hypothetical protein